MVDVKHYGTTVEELEASAIIECRQIVKTINQYGISQKQMLKLIQLLALELENREHMQEIADLIDRLNAGEKRSTLVTDIT